MDANQYEIGLLMENPGELIVKYQPIVVVIVQVYMKSGYFRGEERGDVVQYVNEKLLERMDKIRMQYNGIARLRTYFSAVVRNLCLELIRKGRNRDVLRLVEEQDHNLSYSPDQLNRLIIKQELERLDTVLRLFHTLRPKLVLCLKAILRIPVTENDLYAYCNDIKMSELADPLRMLEGAYSKSDREVYRNLNQLFNHFEEKQNTVDSVRKWINVREEELINLLNGNPPRANHDHETIRILLERYFSEEQVCIPVFHLKIEPFGK